MPVSEGDTILVPLADLDLALRDHIVDVRWTQGFAAMSEKYIQTFFTITKTHDGAGQTGLETQGIIFVQPSLLERFKNKKLAEEPDLTIVVDKEFMFGQKSKDGQGRWLAYHDKQNKPFQHRFITATLKGALNKATEISKKLGFDTAESLLKDASKFYGDYLHNF